jgi:hypothetical protein
MERSDGEMSNQYEVLSPWADVDPVSLKGISPRVADMNGKHVGLFYNSKRAAAPILDVVETKLKERFSNLKFSRFLRAPNLAVIETPDKAKYEEWVKGLDAAIFSVGD